MSIRKHNFVTLENKDRVNVEDELFEKILELVKKQESLNKNAFVTLIFTKGDDIRQLNNNFRGVNAVTDVLSFPSESDLTPFLGDIIIDVDSVRNGCDQDDLMFEIQKVFLHGLLHLLGYDHISTKDKLVMEKKEKEYLEILMNSKG